MLKKHNNIRPLDMAKNLFGRVLINFLMKMDQILNGRVVNNFSV